MNRISSIELPGPDDFHLHLRQGTELSAYALTAAAGCARALIMPNTVPPVTTAEALKRYRERIVAAAPAFEPLMTFKLTENLDPATIRTLAAAGALAGKYYPAGVTTNAADGVRSPQRVAAHLAAMEEAELVLCIHAEEPGAEVLDRERRFLPRIEWIVERFPRLRLVVEHVSDAQTVRFLSGMPSRVGATVTAHHLLYSIDDLLGDAVRPHLYCKPLLKRAADRDALRGVVFSGDRRFFFGSDSAPHPRGEKESACGAAGVYTAPVAVPLLIELFENHDALDRLPAFVGESGADFYRLPRSGVSRRYVKESWIVPRVVDGAVPPNAGEGLSWKIERRER